MCDYCNPESDKCCIWKDSLTNDPYLDIETSEWDEYDDGFIHQKEYISYCPYCGRKLNNQKEHNTEKFLYKTIFKDGKFMLSPEIDSCDFHAMTHLDTEILGQFCDFTGIHNDDLRRILLKGYLTNMKGG